MQPDSLGNYKIFNPEYLFTHGYQFFYNLYHVIFNTESWGLLKSIMIFLSLFFITIIVYTIVRLFEIRKKEHHHLMREIAEYAEHQAERERKKKEGEGVSKNERWRQVITYLFSNSQNDWKLSVLEADTMLETLMDQLGFKGVNLGEKLKSADQNTFPGLTQAWEVHTIRNRIAHEGSEFELSQHEAKRYIAIYEQIFRQYGFI